MRDLLRRRLGVVVLVVVLLVLVLANRVASLLVDLWWFDEVGYSEVFRTLLQTRVLIGGIGAVVLGGLVALNLHIARRMRPLFIPSTPQQAQVERYRELADPYLPWLIAGIAVLFGLSSGFALSVEWESFLLWRNAVDVGVADPQFGKDVGFYLFELPFMKMVQEWLQTSLILTTMLTVGAHYLLGGIRPENPGDKVMPNVKGHLSGLFALILAAWGWGYWLDRFLLNFSPRGTVTGASYTDVNAELTALEILLVVSVVSIALVLYNIRKRGFMLPGAAVGLLLVTSVFLQGAYPAAIQRLQVEPQELDRERPFIERNLEATRAAYGIDEVVLQPYQVANDLDPQQVVDNEVTLTNIRLWDDQLLATTYAELQALRPIYQFNDVDVDRYEIDGEVRQVMLATRNMSQRDVPEQARNWQNLALYYTHGYGLVASQVNTATEDGQPVFMTANIPPTGTADVLVPDVEAGIYYSDTGSPEYNIVNTDATELDYEEPSTQAQVTTSYDGEGGVELSSFVRRLAFALEYADTNILLSGLIRDDSRLLRVRDVDDRVHEVAPYLTLDRDPYPVVLDGRVLWVQDAYTTSPWYPYAERNVLEANPPRLVNYVRNSVKAVVDAYDGTVTLYVADPDDPVLQAWQRVFPTSFTSVDEAPEGLDAHFRYPQDLFELQARVYRTYHIPGVDAFFNKADEWDIPADAAANQNLGGASAGASQELRPYYLLMRLPGEVEEEFVLIQPYLANERPNMVAWLAARSDPEHYGELYAVQFPSDSQILGTTQVQARIEQEEAISEYITLRARDGSRVIRGNMLVLPIERSILYVEPLFLQGDQSDIPELAQVVLVMGQRVVFEETLAEAIAKLVGAPPPAVPDPGQPGVGEPSEQPDRPDPADADPRLLQQALEAFGKAEAALEDGDLGEYQRRIEEARRLVQQALEGDSAEEPTPSPSPAASAEPVPSASPSG